MDLLSDALAIVRLQGAVTFRVDVNGPWCIRAAPGLGNLGDSLPAGANHIAAFHVVLSGECRLRCPPNDWIVAHKGDAVVLPHGDLHDLGDHADDKPVDFDVILGDRVLGDLRDLQFETGDTPHVELLCGFLGCDRRTFTPLFSALPSMFVTRLNDNARSLIDYALDEALTDAPGAAGLRVRIAELMFLETLRSYMRDLPADATGWLAGLQDPVIGKALGLMHGSPCSAWTVESMADRVACSRSRLAERFKSVIGDSPMQYLTRLRMQYAAQRLSDSQHSVAAIADEVGYASPAAFQRAFKRCFGVPPATWRREGDRCRTGLDTGAFVKSKLEYIFNQ